MGPLAHRSIEHQPKNAPESYQDDQQVEAMTPRPQQQHRPEAISC